MGMRRRRKARHDNWQQERRLWVGATMNTGLISAPARARAIFAVVVLCAAAPGSAGDLEYRASLGVGQSDNVRRVPTNETDETIATAGLAFAYDDRTPRLRADITGDFAYYDYLENTYDAELVGNLYADTAFAIVPERFLWSLTDQFGQTLTDPFLPATADNRENINSFSTGPDFMVGLGSQMRLRLGGRYALTNYEELPLDSTNTSGQLALIREISNRSSMSLNANLQQIKYDDELLNADFEQLETYLRYEGQGARTNLTVDIGFSQLDRKALDDTEGGLLLRADASRRVSGSSVVTLGIGSEFSTSAGAFASEQGITNVGIDSAPGRQTAEPFTLDHLTLGWNFNRNVTGLVVTTGWSKRSYDNDPELDQTLTTLSASMRRELSPTTSLEVFTLFSGVSNEPPAADYDDLTAGVSFSWRLSRNLTLDVDYDFSNRRSDAAATEYTENRLWLTIGFGRGDPRSTRVPPTFGVDSMAPAGN
jgi:hypothetical protein